MDPMTWNTLDDAAAWLSERTKSKWDARRVLDAAYRAHTARTPADLSPDLQPTVLHTRIPPGSALCADLSWAGGVPAPAVPLLGLQVVELMVSGRATYGGPRPRKPTDDPDAPRSYPPGLPFVVDLAGVGLSGPDLHALADAEATTPPRRTRRDRMAEEIDAAIARLGRNANAEEVMAELQSIAGRPGSCVTEAAEAGRALLWRDTRGKAQKLTMANLEDRLSRRR